MSTSADPSVSAFRLKLPGRYKVSRHLASGGMASVWCAEDRVLGREVAIKILSERFAQDELAIRRFKREARAAARVSAHAHVVTIFDVGEIEPEHPGDRHLVFIVMEYLPGGTVADALRNGSVTRADTRRWLQEAGSALDHAHERGIVHRDIKPANFLLDRERSLHVADFGIARLQSEDTITSAGQLWGTAAYLSPEQALGREATGASDRYALAVCAFELLTGSRPFTASHFAAQARQHIEDEPPRASQRDRTLPQHVDDVVRRGMAKDPDQRYPTCEAFVSALLGALDGGQTAVTEPLRRRGPAGAAAAGAGLAGAGAAAAGAGAAGAAVRHARSGPRPMPTTGTARGSRTAATSPLRSTTTRESGPSGRAFALAALAVVAIGVIVLISQMGGKSAPSASVSSGVHANTPHKATHKASHRAASSSGTTAPTASSSTNAGTAAELQLLGHQQLVNHNYPAAIATLRRVLAKADPHSLTYAYALYDLGDALLLSGNPRAAVPILEQRLRIPNQTATVQATLDQALQAAGMAPQSTTNAAPPAHHHKGHGNGGGNGQGNGGD